jgi:sugar phosphate isomerase/epimerase
MRIGILTRGETAELDRAQRLGFSSIEWVRFAECLAGPDHTDWKPFADEFFHEAKSRGIRISAIGALYENPLDPKQTERAKAVFRRAIEVAAHLGIRTVAGFPGAVIELEWNERGGNPVYKPFENFFPALLNFWEPLARFAADSGVRIAFEHCPQGAYHLPVMGYNMLAQPFMWERLFHETKCENLGIEWDPSHLLCQWVDPVENIHRFGSRIFHVHAKDAFINRPLLERYGICHPGVAEHRFPGFGQANWAEIIHALIRSGYDSDLNIEGWHDPVFRDHSPDDHSRIAGKNLEDPGLLIAKRHLENFLPPDALNSENPRS